MAALNLSTTIEDIWWLAAGVIAEIVQRGDEEILKRLAARGIDAPLLKQIKDIVATEL